MDNNAAEKLEKEFLINIGVDTRFVIIIDDHIYINNQRFSRFSNKRQELFLRKFPNFSISRSKIFQNICTRASRILAKSLKPGDKIFIPEDDKSSKFILDVIMEPYTRKYGIKIVYGKIEDIKNYEVDSIASSICLDYEVESILKNILNGEKIEVYSLKHSYDYENNLKFVYPFSNVPMSWIVLWLEKLGYRYEITSQDNIEEDIINFFESFIPDVRENILKSALFVSEESLNVDE